MQKPRLGVVSLRRIPWLLMIPGLLAVLIYTGWPILVTLYMSLTRLNIFYLSNWIAAPFSGISNYMMTFNTHSPVGEAFWVSLRDALTFTISAIVLGVPLGMLGAMAMNRKMKGRSFFRVLFLLPYAIPVFVSGLVWKIMFLQQTGLVDKLIALFHLGSDKIFWLIGWKSMVSLVAANVWSSWPFFYLFILAALQSVPEELYEAGQLDGASPMGLFQHITLPQIVRPLLISIALSFIYHFNNFSLPFMMFGTTPPSAVDTLPLNIYIFGFSNMQFGASAAMSVISMIIILIPMAAYLRLIKVGE